LSIGKGEIIHPIQYREREKKNIVNHQHSTATTTKYD
jgi:hypothetical protein